MTSLLAMNHHRKHSRQINVIGELFYRRQLHRHPIRRQQILVYWHRWISRLSKKSQAAHPPIESYAPVIELHRKLILYRLFKKTEQLLSTQQKGAFLSVKYYEDGVRSNLKLQFVRQSKLKSVLQRQFTRRFLRKTERLKFDPQLWGFYQLYRKTSQDRCKDVRLALAVFSKYSRSVSVWLAVAFHLIKGANIKSEAALKPIARQTKQLELTKRRMLTDNLVLTLQQIQHRSLTIAFTLLQIYAKQASPIPRPVNIAQLLRQESKYLRAKLISLYRIVGGIRLLSLQQAFSLLQYASRNRPNVRIDSHFYTNCFQHYCYVVSTLDEQDKLRRQETTEKRKKASLRVLLLRKVAQEHEQKLAAFKVLRVQLLPKYSYRERNDLLKRMEDMQREKKRLISEFEASCS